MDYIHYLIYPIAGILALLAIGGLNSPSPVVKLASACSLLLNGYAIWAFIWWPIPVSFVVDFGFKLASGDPGARRQ